MKIYSLKTKWHKHMNSKKNSSPFKTWNRKFTNADKIPKSTIFLCTVYDQATVETYHYTDTSHSVWNKSVQRSKLFRILNWDHFKYIVLDVFDDIWSKWFKISNIWSKFETPSCFIHSKTVNIRQNKQETRCKIFTDEIK